MKLLCFLFYFIFIISCNTIDNKLTLVEKEMIIYCDSVLNSHINEMKVTKFIDLYYPYLNNNIVKIKFPDLLFKFKNLNSLTITGGPFDSIPDRFREFVCLKDLTLGLSEYENLNEILKKFNKTDIETLSLILKENNKIPEECCLFDNLNTLSIYHFSKYDTLPKCLSRLNKLENLSFIFSEPKVKYNNIEKLNNLRSLTLNYCHNADLRDLFDRLSHLNHLQSLMITDDSLKDIPENVKNLDSLDYIFISSWNLRKLPESLASMKVLNHIGMHESIFDSIPSSYKSLKRRVYIDCMLNIKNIDSLKKEFPNLFFLMYNHK